VLACNYTYSFKIKNKNIMNSNTKMLLGIIAAGAVGVAIGMLLAPEKGSDLRKSLKETLGDLGEKVTDLIAEGKEKLMDVAGDVNTIKKDAQTAAEHGRQAAS
jgi:gas vesicle protein